jgi:hypothetical protein
MTIAAGSLFQDGVILCADTLLSANYRKQGRKVWYRQVGDLEVGITGAGDYVLLKLAATEIMARLTTEIQSGAVVVRLVEAVLASIHDDHIDKAPQWQQDLGYGINLIIGVKTPNIVLLFESSRRAVAPVEGFACVGSGGPVGNYVGSVLHSEAVPVAWGQVMAAYLIQQTKAFGDDCGGETNIVVMPDRGHARNLSPKEISTLEGVATRLHEAFGAILFSCATPKLWGDDQNALQRRTERLREIAQESADMIWTGEPVSPLEPQAVPAKKLVLKSPRHGRKGRTPSQG